MANLALGKRILEPIINAAEATDGRVSGYTATGGFAHFVWPGYLTVDLEDVQTIRCIRLLLWDALGQGGAQRAGRRYKYRLLTSVDHQHWEVIYDCYDDGSNGWQVFDFPGGQPVRYLRIHGLKNSANSEFHIVQVEAHDVIPPEPDAEVMLHRAILPEENEGELGDGLPFRAKILGIVGGIEALVQSSPVLNPAPFREFISDLRAQVRDIGDLERSMNSIRRAIIEPVQNELKESARLSRFSVWGFWVGLIGGVLAIISLAVNLVRKCP